MKEQMTEIRNNMYWIGTIQDLGKTYADLYLDKDGNQLFLLVRVSEVSDPMTRYAAISVTPNLVRDYMETSHPMADVFSSRPFRYASIRDRKVCLEGEQHTSSKSTFLYNKPFDPSMAVNGLKMKMALRKIQQNSI